MLLGHFKQEMFLRVYEAWLSLVERCVRDAEVAGSNPVASTTKGNVNLSSGLAFFCKIIRMELLPFIDRKTIFLYSKSNSFYLRGARVLPRTKTDFTLS